MKILIVHGINYFNAGDHGISVALTTTLQRMFPGAEITVASPFLDAVARSREFVDIVRAGAENEYPVEVPDLYQVPAGRRWDRRTILDVFRAAFLFVGVLVFPWPLRCYLARGTQFGRLLLRSDLIVSKGGGFLLDRGTRYRVPMHLVTLWIAALLRRKVVIYAQTIGPFDKPLSRKVAAWVLRRMDLILVRDEYSRRVVQEELGVAPDRVALTADAAFLLTPSSMPEVPSGARLDRPRGLPHRRAAITLVRPEFAGYHEKACLDAYRHAMVGLANYLGGAHGLQPVFVPHLESGRASDRLLAEEIARLCPEGAVPAITKPCHPSRMLRFLQGCEITVCSRMHSVIFSIVAGVPFVAVSYLPKVDSMLQMLELEDWIVPMHSLWGKGEEGSVRLHEQVSRILGDHARSSDRVRAARDTARAMAERNAELLKRFMGDEQASVSRGARPAEMTAR